MSNQKKNLGFTMIELLVVIGIIGILATTISPKLIKEIRKAKVAKVQHKLGLIRSKLSTEITFNHEFPDLESNDINLLNRFDVHPTDSFSYKNISYTETDQIVGTRDNKGGWFYDRTTGEIYANLPNGAYTYDKIYEIWKGEGFITVEDLQNLEDVGDTKAMEVDSDGNYINNPGFETLPRPVTTWGIFNEDEIEHWETTATDNKIEVWKDGFLGVNAVEGDYFVELNANQVASLYQDIVTIPGTTLVWTVSHRGRSGTDTASMSVGSSSGQLDISETMTTGNDGWVTYTKEYVVPEGQTVTRFSLDSIDSAGGNPSIGNLIDNFSVKVKLDDE
ncbi:MAG: type II secretion system protein [Psychrilyobacter sp.]|uniref:type II secretion system protein n=1 Tax=Psychrilyobacter sp. TaxID=2586924 RepID=UPI003C707D59